MNAEAKAARQAYTAEYRERPENKAAARAYMKVYNKSYRARPENKAAEQAHGKAYYAANKAGVRERQIQQKYGLTPHQWGVMLGQQEGLCAICASVLDRGRHTNVDHCHATGRVRGLLCNHCNRMLGAAKDRPETLAGAEQYLKRAGA